MTTPGTPAAERGEPLSLAGWAKTLQRRIRQRGTDFFILYGPGVRDIGERLQHLRAALGR